MKREDKVYNILFQRWANKKIAIFGVNSDCGEEYLQAMGKDSSDVS